MIWWLCQEEDEEKQSDKSNEAEENEDVKEEPDEATFFWSDLIQMDLTVYCDGAL